MTYQVLARKWRPRTFADLVGQEHVVRALVNALQRGQLHHAYLFTGTRGVGKTTLARILAKTVNCEQGVGPTPCGHCSTCVEIDDGRYVDLIEVDAASRTKVDQTRELLDNVPFSPVRGRFKVYLIDEVHMFSASSFNALLKTLEEPPSHVKFVLATTDPQRLPATVLSRCLQFNLKRLLPAQIKGQFEVVLDAESVAFDDAALSLLAAAADGSMRDGLSLLDQAIAFGGGQVGEADVRLMLGTRSGDLTLNLIEALAEADGARVLDEVGRIAEMTPDFPGVLADLIALLHRIALAQQLPETLGTDDPDHARIAALASGMPAEDVQLAYQVLLTGQRDLPLAPDPRAGLEMVLLRALAFRPQTGPEPGGRPSSSAERGVDQRRPATQASQQPGRAPEQSRGGAPQVPPRAQSAPAGPGPALSEPRRDAVPAAAPVAQEAAPTGELLTDAADWHALIERAGLTGLADQLARHSAFVAWDGRRLRLAIDASLRHLQGGAAEQRLSAALAKVLDCDLELVIDKNGDTGAAETPAQRDARDAAERRADAERLMDADPVARELQRGFDADWIPGSIEASD
jgi:DNA polymerase-3 subunit gamma/tau